MVKIFRFLFLLTIPLFCLSLENGKNRNTREFLEKIQKFQETIKTVKVSFIQTNDFKMLKTPEVLKGTIYIKKPDRALYLYEDPDKLYYLVNKGELLVYNPQKKEAVVQDVERYQTKIMKYMGAQLPFKELEKKFDSEMTEEKDKIVHLSFSPKKKSLQKKLSSLDFWVDKDALTVQKIELSEAEGDKVIFEFKNWNINPELEDKIFEIKIPKGVKVKRSGINIKEPFQ
ncbi:MAG: outer membrane lipoprotein carrier protein LolA [Thermoanaerobaculaceae bacterium]|nr:outer membrane lipoprotein carrier protein LolA [Thermoanaerobaculaceae bacterium]